MLSCDIFPTLLEAAGGDPKTYQPLDGLSLRPPVGGSGDLGRDAILLERPYEDQYAAVVAGGWKLVAYWSGKRELYNLAADPYETMDLAERMPEQTERLSQRLRAWRGEVGLTPEPGGR